jgi:hypothetical protein
MALLSWVFTNGSSQALIDPLDSNILIVLIKNLPPDGAERAEGREPRRL